MYRLSFILSLALLTLPSLSMYLSFTQKPICITIEDSPGKEVLFFFEVMGGNDDKHKVSFIPQNTSQPSYSFESSKNKTKFSNTTMRVCFQSLQPFSKSASLQFYTHDSAEVMELALKGQIYELHTKLIDIGEGIKQVIKNENFEQNRHNYAATMIVEQEGKIKNFALIKIGIIILVAFGQLYLLKSMLSQPQKAYQPV